MTDLRDLCARMADELDRYRQYLMDDRSEVHALATEARAALAKPEPEYPSDVNNLYIINEVLINDEAARYSPGMAVIAAPSLERCREIFEAEFRGGMNEFDAAVKYNNFKVIEAVNHAEGMVSYVCGGG